MKPNDDHLSNMLLFSENPSLNALIRACLGLRAGLALRSGAGAAVDLQHEPMPDFEDTIPASHARLRRVDD